MDSMDPSTDKAAVRIAKDLARNHSDVYTFVNQDICLGLFGSMGKVEAAAMWRDTRLLDSQV